jgi:predicted TIM-barrel fold metal-dependent hydrolase
VNDRYIMISSDCHAGAPWFVYREYLDPDYRDAWDAWVSTHYGSVISKPTREELSAGAPVQLGSMSEKRRLEYIREIEISRGHLGNWDPDVRLRELDREGIAGEVVFCDGSQNNHPPFGVGFFLPKKKAPLEHRIAGCRAHNRWLAELCATNPGRHAGVALVPIDDPETAVVEIRRAHDNGLFGGIMLPGLQLDTDGPEEFWHHPKYESVWKICAELSMPLNTHASNSNINYGGSKLVRGIENHFTTFRPFWFLLWAGVFERYPELKLCITESGGMQTLWIKAYLDYLVTYRRTDEAARTLSMKPSEYWDRQCFIGASAHSSRAEIDHRHAIGIRSLMWGSDYPHPEGTWPASMERTKELFAGIPQDEIRMMIGGNAGRAYGFDMEKMTAVAARIGPEVGDFTTRD